jgi:drug/metabolite transporter (DMT)-like permease
MLSPSRVPILLQAVLLSLLGVLLLDSMGAVIKHLGTRYPAQELSAFRNLFGMAPSILVLLLSAEWRAAGRPWRIGPWKLALARGLMVAAAQFCFYTAILHLEFATAVTLVFAQPLLATGLSVLILKEKVGAWRWSAVALGFAGIILVMRPGSEVFSWYAVLPLGAAAGYALSAVSVRLMPTEIPSATVNLYSHLGALVCSTALMLATTGFVAVERSTDWLWLIGMGGMGGTGVLCLVIAYRKAKPSILAPFDYFGIIFSFGLGWVFFAEAPFERLFPGVLLIVAAGVMIIWRERRPARDAKPEAD